MKVLVHCVGRSHADPAIGYWHVNQSNALIIRNGKKIPYYERLAVGDVWVQRDDEYVMMFDNPTQVGSGQWLHCTYTGPDWRYRMVRIDAEVAKTIYSIVGMEFPEEP